VNTNIRRAAVSITAAGALALAGGGTAMADDASYEHDSSAETASAGPNGAYASSYEQSEEAEANVNPYYDNGNHNGFDHSNHNGYDNRYSDDDDDDGLLGLGILSSDDDHDHDHDYDSDDDSLLGIL
jgi:outer membrane scaffolding protein for murein synthesis (MipA/OmpV family)